MKTTLLVTAVATASAIGSSDAATISVDDQGGFAFEGSASSHTIMPTDLKAGGFDANGSDKLVVSITGERAGTSNNTVSGVTYGGQPLVQAVADNSNVRKLSIWYLDNVTVTGNIVVSYVSRQSGIGIAALALSGTAAGVADTADNNNGTATPDNQIITTTAGELVLAAGVANGGAISASSPLNPLLSSADGSTGSSTGAAGFYAVPIASSFTPAFAGDENYVAASFQAVIPEPSSLALLGLGTLMIARRRRG